MIWQLFLSTGDPQNPPHKTAPVQLKPAAFDHKRAEHQQACDSCHVRENDRVTPSIPYHTGCTNCHVADFISEASRLCDTCHQLPFESRARVIAFPERMQEFGLKTFSHRDHMNLKDNKLECRDCHAFGPAFENVKFPRHADCYKCHAHQASSRFGRCETCHVLEGESMDYRKGYSDPTMRYNFHHSTHLRHASIRLDCSRCHKLTGTENPKLSDVTQIRTDIGSKHTSGCWNCHNPNTEGQRNCLKCHLQGIPGFKF